MGGRSCKLQSLAEDHPSSVNGLVKKALFIVNLLTIENLSFSLIHDVVPFSLFLQQQKLLTWQLAYPNGSAEECKDWMREIQANRQRTE